MPTVESFYNMEEVNSQFLLNGITTDTVLVLDCRSQSDYQDGHIDGAMHVNLPPLLLRRLKKGSLAVSTAVQGNDMKEKFSTECHCKDIVLYDCDSCDVNANSANLLPLIHQKLVQDNCKVKVLSGMYLTNHAACFQLYTHPVVNRLKKHIRAHVSFCGYFVSCHRKAKYYIGALR